MLLLLSVVGGGRHGRRHNVKLACHLRLLEVKFEMVSHIFYFVFDEHAQDRYQLLELIVVHAVEPADYVDSIVRLQVVILSDVVHNDGFRQVTAKPAQVLHVDALAELAAVAVEPVADTPQLVEVVQDPVGVLFKPRRENDQLVVLGHLAYESLRVRPGAVVPTPLVEVHESLIEVQHQRVLSMLFFGEAMVHRRQKVVHAAQTNDVLLLPAIGDLL